MVNLCKDVFGNYIIQRLLSLNNPNIVRQFVEKIKNNLIEISISTYGCRVIQKAIEVLGDNYYFADLLIPEINKNTLRFIMDHNSNHIIQKLFEVLPDTKTQHILDIIVEEAELLLADPNGCRVI